MSLLIVGARPGSLGAAVKAVAKYDNWNVFTAGVSGEEDDHLNLTKPSQIKSVLRNVMPTHIVCTAGVNMQIEVTSDYLRSCMTEAFLNNVIGPMSLLQTWLQMDYASPTKRKFVVISSNSARIARTGSLPYCSSKAALSMAVRVAARELARANAGVEVYGYEPGLLDTSMTREMFPSGDDPEHPGVPASGPMHRMEGVRWQGIHPEFLAHRILNDLRDKSGALNGTLVQFDAGEQ